MTYAITLPDFDVFNAWRAAARRAISHQIAPEDLDWCGSAGLFAADPLPQQTGCYQLTVPANFLTLAGFVIWHEEPERFALLYQALWQLDQKQGDPLSHADKLGNRLQLMAKSVRRDIHKIHAFVRFRELPSTGLRRHFGAWFEPDHHTLEPAAPFFAKRFADMDWMIATPKSVARFENGALTFHQGGPRPHLPDDASETLWATYFANIFNPARIKLDAMRSEMPQKYWKNLPETKLIPDMLKDADSRVARMREATATRPRPGAAAVSTRYRATMPKPAEQPQTLEEAESAARQCRRCGLCEAATQTVWGEGPSGADLMIVGEQPGDQEDLAGRPFVGPAGQLLKDAMAQASVEPNAVWLTNAVKHFKFTPRGKRRLHQNPDKQEIRHCRWWIGLELAFIQPRLVMALGGSAAFALTDNATPLGPRRGTIETGLHGGPVLISWHPSYILRLPDKAAQEKARAELIADIRHAQHQLANPSELAN